MIYNLIGSGILVAVGAGLGGLIVWADMHQRLSATRRRLRSYQDDADKLYWQLDDALSELDGERFALANERRESAATIARLSDTVGQLQYKRDKTLEYCKQFRVRGAKVAGILSGEQDQ